MNCSNCNKEIPDNSKFCPGCGTKIEAEINNIKEKNEKENIQIEEYYSLPWYKSYRKGVAILFIIFAIIDLLLIFFEFSNYFAFFDVFLLIFLAWFIYEGKKWAIISGLIYVLISIIYIVMSGEIEITFIKIMLWIAYINFLYQALKIEKMRDKLKEQQKI